MGPGAGTGSRGTRLARLWALGFRHLLAEFFFSAWLLARAGVRWRRGYATDGRGFLLHDKLAWEPHSKQHRAEAYVHVLPVAVRPQGTAQGFWQEPAHHGTEPDTLGICDQFDARRAWPVDALVEAPHTPIGSWLRAAWQCPAAGQLNGSRRWPNILRIPRVSLASW